MKIGPILRRKTLAIATMTLIVANLILQAHPIWAGNQFADPIVSHSSAIVLGNGAEVDIEAQVPVNDDPNEGMGIYYWRLSIHSTNDTYYYAAYKTSRDFYEVPQSLFWNGRGYIKDEQGVTQPGVFPVGIYEVYFEVVYAYFNIVNGLTHVNPGLGETVSYTGSIRVVATEDELESTPEPSITPEPSPEPTVTPSITPTPTPTPSPTPEEDVLSEKYAKLHPVLFIHGLASYPEMWQDAENNSDYFGLLKKWGYPDEYLAAYSYTGTGVGINGYNNQGHIPDAAAGMRDAVLALSEISKQNGGDGQVDIVAHSMGGLIVGQYLLHNSNDGRIRNVVTMGAPFQGSFWMENYNLMHSNKSPDNFKSQLSTLIGVIMRVNPDNPGPQDMVPGSDFLQSISYANSTNIVNFYTIYGSIYSKTIQDLFNLTLESDPESLGDLVVSEASARRVSTNQAVTSYQFAESDPYRAVRYLSPEVVGYRIRFKLPSIDIMRYNHFSIISQSEVQSRVIKLLDNNE